MIGEKAPPRDSCILGVDWYVNQLQSPYILLTYSMIHNLQSELEETRCAFMLKSTFIQLPLSQETHLVLSSILQHGHYDEVNQWMLPQILSTTLYVEHSQWTFVSVDHAFRFLPHWSAVCKCKIATTVFSLSLIVIRWLQ